MTTDFLKAIRELEQFAAATTRQEYFRKLRDADTSEVFDNFVSIVSAEDPTINRTTGIKHTVESMVSELQSRTGLEALLKKRSEDGAPTLSRKARYLSNDGAQITEEQLIAELEEFSKKYFLERDHGLSSVETVIEDFKSRPGGMRAIEAFGRERVRDILRDIVSKYPKDDPMASLPRGDAMTMPAADQADPSQGESANVGMGGSPGVTSR
jgi:hypothetical protein